MNKTKELTREDLPQEDELAALVAGAQRFGGHAHTPTAEQLKYSIAVQKTLEYIEANQQPKGPQRDREIAEFIREHPEAAAKVGLKVGD